MDISTNNWFEYLREEVLTEGLRDIGLPEIIVDFIEEGMPNAPEKSKTYAGNNWKEHRLGNPGYIDAVQENWLNQMDRMFRDQIHNSTRHIRRRNHRAKQEDRIRRRQYKASVGKARRHLAQDIYESTEGTEQSRCAFREG
jgi:hypothetical protein